VQRFLPGSELGITPQGLAAPPGVVAGQKIKLFFNQLVRADLGEPDMGRWRCRWRWSPPTSAAASAWCSAAGR
jgi:hypothetical protein